MKVERSEVKDKSFKPFKLELTFETEEEASILYAMCNWIPTAKLLDDHGFDTDAIREKMKDAGVHSETEVSGDATRALRRRLDPKAY